MSHNDQEAMKKIPFIIVLILVSGCIPYKIAPNIEDYKIVRAKKFKRDLPELHAFVFEDEREADEFYHFVNAKFALEHQSVDSNVRFEVGDMTYYMSFYEREKTTETVNLFPILVDGILDSEGVDPILEESYTTGNSNWYIIITVTDSNSRDCLSPSYEYIEDVILFLRALKLEYQGLQNYAGTLTKT